MSKRAIDIGAAALLLVLVFPLICLSSLLILIDSDGPVLFRQWRVGRDFKLFQLVKLRTMRASEEGVSFTLGPDPRITRIGGWLRWLKFDELPQMWNVLRGDMSLVGPRPVVPELAAEFRAEYGQLLHVRPGLTDPATIKYCREGEVLALVPDPLGYFKSVVTPDKLRLSRDYLESASVWTDFGVLARTAIALLPAGLRLRAAISPRRALDQVGSLNAVPLSCDEPAE